MERASGSENGDLIETCMKEGKIVPVEITISLIEKVQHFVLNVCFGIMFCFHSLLLLYTEEYLVVAVLSSMKKLNLSEFLFQSMSLHVK